MKYEHSFEIASLAVRELKRLGWKFERGTPRKAALAATQYETSADVKSAIKNVLRSQGVKDQL